MGASHKDRRKELPHCRWGQVSILCEFGHLLAEVTSLRLVSLLVGSGDGVCVVGMG